MGGCGGGLDESHDWLEIGVEAHHEDSKCVANLVDLTCSVLIALMIAHTPLSLTSNRSS